MFPVFPVETYRKHSIISNDSAFENMLLLMFPCFLHYTQETGNIRKQAGNRNRSKVAEFHVSLFPAYRVGNKETFKTAPENNKLLLT